jgi:hypothetical protein
VVCRIEGQRPAPYPVASAPQAWAAGALPYALWTLLGLASAHEQRPQVIRPVLPDSLQWLDVGGLRVGGATVDLHLRRGDQRQVVCDAEVREGTLACEQLGRLPAPEEFGVMRRAAATDAPRR